MEFPEGRGGLSWEPILENPERGRGHRKNPFRGGGGYGYFLEPHIAYAKNTRFFQPVCRFCKRYFSKLKSNPAKKTSEQCFSGETKPTWQNSSIF